MIKFMSKHAAMHFNNSMNVGYWLVEINKNAT